MKKFTIRKKAPAIRFSGSCIQQNHGEALLGHGFSLWDVKNRTYKHVEIQNDYGYFTIDIDDGKLMTDITDMPKRPKLRVRCKETIATEVKNVINEIKKTHDISEIIFMRVDGDDIAKVSSTTTLANLQKITDVDYQNKLISECLKAKYPEIMDEDTLKSVHKINEDLNKLLGKEDVSRNIRWKPIKFEFSNMFSYGEGNIIDFTKLEDVYGLFAANASGKSSLMDALCFTMFDKSARAFKAVHVMNTQKMTFSGKFTFEINDVRYVIEREGKRDKKNNVKVDVNFYKLEKEEKISLNSEARRSTNEIVRDYLGDYEEFVLTSVALQGNQGSFIDMGQSERKELLCQFIGLNIFDKLASEASDKVKELSGAVKTFNKESNYNKVESLKNERELLESKLIDLNSQKDRHTSDKQIIDGEIESNQANLVKLDNVSVNVPSLKKERDGLIQRNAQYADAISKIQTEQTDKKDEYLNATTTLEALPTDLKEKADKHASLTRIKQRTEQEIEKIKLIFKEKLKKIDHLAKHEYDPNCKYCCNNAFVKDATIAKDSIDADKKEAKVLFDSLTETKNQLEEISAAVDQYQTSVSLKEKINLIAAFLSKKEVDKLNNNNSIDRNNTMIADIDGKIDMYERSKEIIENNRVILDAIGPLKTRSNDIASRLKNINTEYMNAYSRKVSVTDQIKGIEEQMTKIESYENEIASYQYYTTSVGKDGVPYKIISDAIPRIEQEANNILSQIVEFTIGIETDGKNVNVYIKYEDRRWPLELSSGMERFVAALALRVALINISNLPRANFLVVDEGFGALDASNMAMIHSLFDYLKSNFDFIIVISHLDAMRDMVDKQLEIKKENGFSKLDNTV